ncbi:tensin-1-like [Osmerus eperlanus]|uniref:tensin-1-like n=1 Tax=Osmerus eperlanus TaxID=29151 RepID=UPI002E0D476B
MPSVSLSLPAALTGRARTWVCLSCMLWPEEFDAVHSHTFRVKTFKKGKHCGACKQTVSQEGLICRGQYPASLTLRRVEVVPYTFESKILWL